MKAGILQQVGGPLVIEEIPEPIPLQGEVLVRVAACGVCHGDLHVIKGELGFPLSTVLGHEISGTVSAVGTDVSHVASGEITRLVRRSITIKGSYGGRMRADLPVRTGLVARGQISTSRLITRRFRLDEAAAAYTALDQGKIIGRAIVTMT